MQIIGYYNKDGYTIETTTGIVLYSAGNNPMESSSVIADGLPLETIKSMCDLTGREIAAERNAEFVGAEPGADETPDPQAPTKDLIDRYIQSGGNFCPFCESGNIEGCSRDSDDGYTTQLVICSDCQSQWQDFYELTAILDISGDRIEGAP
ncbi:MAG: hypothetical protein WC294_00210 [Methanoregula sp.]|jgi:hypothetical protein